MTDESIVITGIQRRATWLDGTPWEHEIAPSISPSGIQDEPITVRRVNNDESEAPFTTPHQNVLASFRCHPDKADGHWLMTGSELVPTPQAHADELTKHLNFASAPETPSDRLVISQVAEVPYKREQFDASTLVLQLVDASMGGPWTARRPLARHLRNVTVFGLPDAGEICPQRRVMAVDTNFDNKLVVKARGNSELQEQFVEELLEPVALALGLPVEWVIDERIVPDVQRQASVDLGAAGLARPQYRTARNEEVPNVLFEGDFHTRPVPVQWMGGRLMHFELNHGGTTPLEAIRDSIAGFLDDASILDELTQQVFEDCMQCMHDTDYGDPMPFVPPAEPADVWDMEELWMDNALQIRSGRNGEVLIGIDFTPPWEEHGLNLFFEGATVRWSGRHGDSSSLN